MTTTTPASDSPAVAGFVVSGICPHGHVSALEHEHNCGPCRELAALLPRLKQPSWVHLIGAQIRPEAAVIVEDTLTKAQKKRRAKTAHKRYVRLMRALRGEHTRVRKPTLCPA